MVALCRILVAGILAVFASGAGAVELGDDGLHDQPWFHEGFLEFSEDLAEAKADGKDLIVLIEQRGCPYCREMHEVNFERDDITSYIQEKYLVVQIDMWGSREVTDFDGQALEERDLVRKWRVSFTPTTLFFAWDDDATSPESMDQALVFLMPGYFKPFHHLSALEYVASDGYKDEPNFQRWLQAKADHMREQGQEVTIWE